MAILREERIGGQRLLLGDCLHVMPLLGKVDAVVTDPPYGIGYQHSGKSGGKWHRSNTKPIINDDRAFDPAPFLDFPEVLMWGADHFRSRLPEGGRMLAWNKLGDLPDMGDSFGNVEFAWHSRKGKADIVSCTWKGIIRVGSGEQGGPRHHPSQKPIAVMDWCLRQVAGQTILDPFMGSGTTLVACQRLGRHGTGIELDPDYFDIACRRVDEAARQPDLLIPETRPQPVQEQLI
jgi:site-specific DNA-methyltransferase (adenine-specific)